MDLGLRGKTVLITGGSRGIGAAVAASFAAEGARLILVSRSKEQLEQAARRIADVSGAQVETHAADLAGTGQAAALARKYPSVDVLVNNAGAIGQGTIFEIDESAWRQAWELKVFGYINLCREYFGLMRTAGAGVIVNVIGLAAEKLDDGYIAGSSGNAALVAFTRALGSRSVDHGVRIVGVNPGWVETDKSRTSLEAKAEAELGDKDKWRELARRRWGIPRLLSPDEIGDVVAFAASERARGISGQVITVDAGFGARSYPR